MNGAINYVAMWHIWNIKKKNVISSRIGWRPNDSLEARYDLWPHVTLNVANRMVAAQATHIDQMTK